MDLSKHIKDLITAYESMNQTPRRETIINKLREVYLLATSDALGSSLSTKTTQSADVEQNAAGGAENRSNGLHWPRAYGKTEYFKKLNNKEK